jgi:hypothetical protein
MHLSGNGQHLQLQILMRQEASNPLVRDKHTWHASSKYESRLPSELTWRTINSNAEHLQGSPGASQEGKWVSEPRQVI